jgi:hypothetical protein
MSDKKRWLLVVIYAIAMAWVESAAVLYLRTLNGTVIPFQQHPNPFTPTLQSLNTIEMVREAATLLMLLTVGWLAGQSRRARLGYVVIAFGLWDIFYYVFLKVMIGWPASLLDSDVLFLLPLPWLGPVLAPVLIALLMVVGGTLLVYFNPTSDQFGPTRWSIIACLFGVGLSLFTFMSDALRELTGAVPASANGLPAPFNWPQFCLALILLSAPIFDLVWQGRSRSAVKQISL